MRTLPQPLDLGRSADIPLLRWLPFEPLAYCLEQSASRLILLDAERADVILPAVSRLRNGEVAAFLVWDTDALQPSWDGLQLWSDLERLGDDLPGVEHPLPAGSMDILPEDDATIFFTSGTYVMPYSIPR